MRADKALKEMWGEDQADQMANLLHLSHEIKQTQFFKLLTDNTVSLGVNFQG